MMEITIYLKRNIFIIEQMHKIHLNVTYLSCMTFSLHKRRYYLSDICMQIVHFRNKSANVDQNALKGIVHSIMMQIVHFRVE